MQRRQRGAVLASTAAIMMTIIVLGALLLGIAYRLTQRQRAKAALAESTRTIAQLWNYDRFAYGISEWNDPQAIPTHGQQLLITDISNVPGLTQSSQHTALQARWNLLPDGGTCEKHHYTVAVICGSLDLEVRSFPLGFSGTSTIHVESAVILDQTP